MRGSGMGERARVAGWGRAGFTLVELLVSIAAIVLLLAVLFPSVSAARRAAQEAACLGVQRRLTIAVLAHAGGNRDEIPGLNTTNKWWLRPPRANRLLGETTPTTPTSVFDWISPVMGTEMGFSANRAERTRQIFAELSCPSAGRAVESVWGVAGDRAEFESAQAREPFLQISYLSPGAFHLAGTFFRGQAEARVYGWTGPAVPPAKYFPRLDRVGAPAEKVFLLDATRYLASPEHLDFDVNPAPRYYGSFTASPPVYVAAREFGSATVSPEFPDELRPGPRREVYPFNAGLTYRHGGSTNVLHFDGHAGRMTEAETKADASPWFPSGSVFTGVNATPESLGTHAIGDDLR